MSGWYAVTPASIGGILHSIAQDTDAATQRLLQSLGTAKHGPSRCEVKLGKAEIGSYLLAMPLFSAGKPALVDLRGQSNSGICNWQENQ